MGLVIFDCDGVLVDSEFVVIEIESELLTDAGFPITADEIADTCVGLSYGDMMALLESRFGRPVPESLNERIQEDVLAAFPEQLEAVVGITDLLGNHEGPRCIASSSDLGRLRLSLEITELELLFDPALVFSAQMVERGKPAPDLFLHAAQVCGAEPSECVVIEDSPHGVTAALAAGMNVIGFAGGRHVRPSLIAKLRDAGAELIANDAVELALMLGER